MKSDKNEIIETVKTDEDRASSPRGPAVLESGIGDSLDLLVDYLVDNDITGIHPLIMGEVEKRLIVKALQRSRGNKLQAAKLLGIGRNTFHRKIQKLADLQKLRGKDPKP